MIAALVAESLASVHIDCTRRCQVSCECRYRPHPSLPNHAVVERLSVAQLFQRGQDEAPVC
jgi:hypothetical protein